MHKILGVPVVSRLTELGRFLFGKKKEPVKTINLVVDGQIVTARMMHETSEGCVVEYTVLREKYSVFLSWKTLEGRTR
jgi:hypothetical protein